MSEIILNVLKYPYKIIHLGNVDLHNVSVQNHHKTGTGDVYIEGYNITLNNIYMKISSLVDTVQTNMIYHGLTVAAPHVTVHNDIHIRCPVVFRVDVYSVHTPTYSMLSVQCHSCEADQYTIVEPVLRISDISANHSVPQVGPCGVRVNFYCRKVTNFRKKK